MFYLDVLMISLIVCYIIDVSGITEIIKQTIWKWVYGGKLEYKGFTIKPFDCSRCMCFWVGLIWCLCTAHFQLYHLLYVCLMSLLSEQFSNFITIIQMGVQRLADALYDYIERR